MLSFIYRVKFERVMNLEVKNKSYDLDSSSISISSSLSRDLIEDQPVGFIIGFIGLIGRRPAKKNEIQQWVKIKNNL